MPTLPRIPDLPDVPVRRAPTLLAASRGPRRRAYLFLGGEPETAAAIALLGPAALTDWRRRSGQLPMERPAPLGVLTIVGGRPTTLHGARWTGLQGTFEALRQAGQLVRSALALGPQEVVLWGSDDTARAALWSAWVAAQYELPELRSRAGASRPDRPLAVPVGLSLAAQRHGQAIERGAAFARWLTALPGNHLSPRVYRQRVETLARRHGWRLEILDERALRRAGAGAFLAVAQGNRAADACLIRVAYRPRPRGKRGAKSAAPVALVGKGVCFDTGGVNLKTHRGMLDMHMDMAGSAVTLGTLLALSELDHPQPVDAWLALAENHLDAAAYKPQDVVRASNGTTIQVIHTDAEGRMLLADALALASRSKPRLLVDFATLTGACISALTERYAGLFTNRLDLRQRLEAVGQVSGERVWAFPLDPDFDTDLESRVADIAQCPVEGKGDHIHAARFLQRFVAPGLPWIHLDLAPAHRRGGLAHITTDITGFGVRYAATLLQDHDLLRALDIADPPSH